MYLTNNKMHKLQSKNLLFTSAGDKTNFFDYWCDDTKNYDIVVCYYGDQLTKPYKNKCDFYFERKGSKFQNFYYLWNSNLWTDNLKTYDNFFIIDDDIIISTREINELFNILHTYNLWILQPSFSNKSKISHQITKNVNGSFMRYVNFVEVCVMMFNKYAIKKCMEIYDPLLVGYGVDYLFLWYLGAFNNKFAIVDHIQCVNPKYEGTREICKLQSIDIRINIFDCVKKKFGFSEWRHIEYSKIVMPTFNAC